MERIVPLMDPATGETLQRFVGDHIRFCLKAPPGAAGQGWRALLRTNIGRGELLRQEIIQAHTRGLPVAGASWRDIPMEPSPEGWEINLALAETGYFKAKAYLVDARGWQHWPHGSDVGISVHPNAFRTGNTIYCAFTRMFGETRTARTTTGFHSHPAVEPLDASNYTVIPPSGKLRDLVRCLPHIVGTLQCRILHLLPVHPTPTTYAKFGRFGSPYAALDLTAIDPALVEFDRRTTGIDQFRELTCAAHELGARVILDIVINHTGWGSVLQEQHPEWFLRDQNGVFVSPGAWGTTWEDLVELRHNNVELWDQLAETFLVWCRRGVDGFRCDAGYKVPLPAWQYIVNRVQQEYPDTLFLLEGLGGAWEATDALLQEGGMQWAYSELFQNYSGEEVGSYLDHVLRHLNRTGLLVHYSETHDNPRLASRGRAWSCLRNSLSALSSISGGFGFTCGVEWLATEKVLVHGSTGMAWGAADNIVAHLARLNELLTDHPCFFDGAAVRRISPRGSPVLALFRTSRSGEDKVLILVNTDPEHSRSAELAAGSAELELLLCSKVDLLGQPPAGIARSGRGSFLIELAPAAAHCLATTRKPAGLSGEMYRRKRALAAFGITAISRLFPVEKVLELDWQLLAGLVERSPENFLAAVSVLHADEAQWADGLSAGALDAALHQVQQGRSYKPVISWSLQDARRVTLLPAGHWLLVKDPQRFRATFHSKNLLSTNVNVESLWCGGAQIASFGPLQDGGDATLRLERYDQTDRQVMAKFRCLRSSELPPGQGCRSYQPDDVVLLTNGRGGMARMRVDLGRIDSKYDCVLGANPHPNLPVDRHVFVKRLRAWINADGFISPLNFGNLAQFEPGPPATWSFVANAGDGRVVEVRLAAEMVSGKNTVIFRLSRPGAAQAQGKQVPGTADVRITIRVDIEDRSFHSETRRNGGADYHFSSHTRQIPPAPDVVSGNRDQEAGFEFLPAPGRHLRVFSLSGFYHAQPEWAENIQHPIEQTRGQVGSGDAYSPGWFDLPLAKGTEAILVVSAEQGWDAGARHRVSQSSTGEPGAAAASFAQRLAAAIRSFVVKRGDGVTVIAGYPWFLDWGRDTFICARGMISAGMTDEVRELLRTFAAFEDRGTLPNTIFGEDASNRDTSDAPLCFALVAEELAARCGQDLYSMNVGKGDLTLRHILESIAHHYILGTPNRIKVDSASGLVWSPSHFTWMDTNHPACTPREGYPVEIQVLWIRLLRQLSRITVGDASRRWEALAHKAQGSFEALFWVGGRDYLCDLLIAGEGEPAIQAVRDDALRSNCLFAISLGLISGEPARRCVAAAQRHLVVPGGLRSLAPLPVTVPLINRGNHGQVLNNPSYPYWGRYLGDEDTQRKPAYHNGTAWTWTFPTFCEALAQAWEFSPDAVNAARAYLLSMEPLVEQGCIGHLPEVLDGDAPHLQRGCDAQAWAATEALRVWTLLQSSEKPKPGSP